MIGTARSGIGPRTPGHHLDVGPVRKARRPIVRGGLTGVKSAEAILPGLAPTRLASRAVGGYIRENWCFAPGHVRRLAYLRQARTSAPLGRRDSMSTPGKVLVVLLTLASLVWILMASSVAQINNVGSRKF